MRDSFEPGTRWSTRTPSRASGPGANSATIGGKVVDALQVLHDDALDPQVVAPHPLHELRVVPPLDVDPARPARPGPAPRARPANRTRCGRGARARPTRGAYERDDLALQEEAARRHREDPVLAEAVLQGDRRPLRRLLAADHGSAEPRGDLLDDEVGLGGDLGSGRLLLLPRRREVRAVAAHGLIIRRWHGPDTGPGARATTTRRIRTASWSRWARTKAASTTAPCPGTYSASSPPSDSSRSRAAGQREVTASGPACGSPDSSTRSPQKTISGDPPLAGTRTARSCPLCPGPTLASSTWRPPRSSVHSPHTAWCGTHQQVGRLGRVPRRARPGATASSRISLAVQDPLDADGPVHLGAGEGRRAEDVVEVGVAERDVGHTAAEQGLAPAPAVRRPHAASRPCRTGAARPRPATSAAVASQPGRRLRPTPSPRRSQPNSSQLTSMTRRYPQSGGDAAR